MSRVRSVLRLLYPGALRHALAHKAINLVAIAGIALGVATLVAVRLTTASASASFATALEAVAGRATLSIRAPAGEIPDALYERLRPVLARARLMPVLETTGLLMAPGAPRARGEACTLLGLDLVALGSGGAGRAGAPPASRATLLSALDARSLFVPGEILARLGVADGGALDVLVDDKRQRVTAHCVVSGGAPSDAGASKALAAGLAVQDIAAFQTLWGRAGALDRIDVEPRVMADRDAVAQEVRALLPPGIVAEAPERRTAQVDQMLKAYRFNLGALAFISLLVGGFFIHNAMAVAVARRQGEIALMRALGASQRQVAALFLTEAAATGVVAWVPGLALGWLLAYAGMDAVGRTVNAFYLPTRVTLASLTPELALGSLALAVVVTVIAALVPAREAAACEPATRLRPGARAGARKGRTGPLTAAGAALLVAAVGLAQLPPVGDLPVFGMAAATAVVAGIALLLPAVFAAATVPARAQLRSGRPALGLAAAILGAYPGRAAVAAASLVAAVALVGSMDVMVGSFRRTVLDWVDQTLTGEVFVRPAGRAGSWKGDMDSGLVAAVRAIPGVAAVDRVTVTEVDLDGAPVRLQTHDFAVMAEHGRLDILDPAGADARQLMTRASNGDGLFVSEPLAYRRKLRAGDTLHVPLGPRGADVRVLGVYRDYSYDRGVIRMDRAFHQHLAGGARIGGLTVHVRDGAADAVVTQLRHALAGREVVLARQADIKRDAAAIFDQTFAVTRALKGIATLVALIGILGTLVLFAQVELPTFALLRTVGASVAQVRRVMFSMGLALGVVGTAGGLAAALGVGHILIHVVNRQSFGWTIVPYLDPAALVPTAIAVPLAALAAALVPAGSATAVPPAAALRAE